MGFNPIIKSIRKKVSKNMLQAFLSTKTSTRRLKKICVEEGLESEQVALDFIAARSCGSLRDAETMLDQLSLLGKKITISLVHELVSVVLCSVRVCPPNCLRFFLL